MSFASPFPEVDIPTASVYDYLFGGIDEADLDRVALIDTKSGRQTTYRELIGPHRHLRRGAGRPRHRRRRRGRPARTQQLRVRRRLSRHSALGSNGHHHQCVVHRQGHRQAADRLEGQDAGHRHAAAAPGQRGGRNCGSGRYRPGGARRRRADGQQTSERGRSARTGVAGAGGELRSVRAPGGASLQLRHHR